MIWEEVLSNEVLDIRDGTHDSPKYLDKGFPLITSKNLKQGKIDFNEVSFISEDDYNAINKRSKVDKGDILYSMIGSIGNYAFIDKTPDYAIKNVALFKFVDGRLDNRYFLFLLNSPIINRQINMAKKGGTQKFVSLGILRNLKIPLPPLNQQKRIATILDAADAYRQKTKALIAKYDELTQSLFLDMFGDPAKNPFNWELKSCGDYINYLADIGSNGANKIVSEKLVMSDTEDYAVMIRTTNLNRNDFKNNIKYVSKGVYDFFKKSQVFGGEIIMNKIGSAGDFWLMPKLEKPVSLGLNQFLIRLKDINLMYFYYFLSTDYGTINIKSRCNGAATKSITKTAVRELPILFPPIDLQNQFADRIQVIETQKAQAQTNLKKSNDLFNSLLQKAFKGELT